MCPGQRRSTVKERPERQQFVCHTLREAVYQDKKGDVYQGKKGRKVAQRIPSYAFEDISSMLFVPAF